MASHKREYFTVFQTLLNYCKVAGTDIIYWVTETAMPNHQDDRQNQMLQIYALEVAHQDDPSKVELAQKLTLDKDRPQMGLAGIYGLFGSPDWWTNLNAGRIPITEYTGIIETVQFSGMHNESRSFTLRLTNGGRYTYTCVANQKRDLKRYRQGRKVTVIAFTEKLKRGEDLEMVWSIEIECA